MYLWLQTARLLTNSGDDGPCMYQEGEERTALQHVPGLNLL